MSMLTTYPGMSADPVRDSKEISKERLVPIVEQLRDALRALDRYVADVDYDDDGHHGD